MTEKSPDCARTRSSRPFREVKARIFLLLAAMLALMVGMSLALPARASSFFEPIEDQMQDASAPSDDTMVQDGIFVMVHEAAFYVDDTTSLTWSAELDEHGNAARTYLRHSLDPTIAFDTQSDVTYDELGGMVSSLAKTTMTQNDGQTTVSVIDEAIIVDERSGRVDSYMRESTTVLLGYGQSGNVEQITYLYGFNEPSGSVTIYNDRGLPVQVDNIVGHDEAGQLAREPQAQVEWFFDEAGKPVEVCVRNAQTGSERRYQVQTDEHGNVVGILRDDGTTVLEFVYEYVENPSPLVAAMPPEYLADIVHLIGVPE